MNMSILEQSNPDTDMLKHLFDLYQKAVTTSEKAPYKEQLKAGANQFVEFAREYLNSNRPTNVFYSESNMGFVLQDNTRLLVAPKTAAEGPKPAFVTAAGANAVPMSTHKDAPSGLVDYKRKSTGVDKTQNKGEVKYNVNYKQSVDLLD